MDTDVKISPSGRLILEVLAARHRLGESFWTFTSEYGSHIRRLQQDGLVSFEPGSRPKTLRVRLTELGQRMSLSDTYEPPVCTQCQAGICSAHQPQDFSDDERRIARRNFDFMFALVEEKKAEIERLRSADQARLQLIMLLEGTISSERAENRELREKNRRLGDRMQHIVEEARQLRIDADDLRTELSRWNSGQRRKGMPAPWVAPDGIQYAAALLHAQVDDDEKLNDLLVGAARRLKDLSDWGSRAQVERDLMDAVCGNLYLHGSWFRMTVNMTTDEKEAFYAAIKRWDLAAHEAEGGDDADPGYSGFLDEGMRWWRDDYTGPPVGRANRLKGDGR